jgi:quinol monooxygenase YgiN
MTICGWARHKVQDFATWKNVYDEGSQRRAEVGVIADRVFHDLDDPNVVVVYHEFESKEKLNAFMARAASDDFRKRAGENGGVLLDTLEVWTGEEV